MSKISKLHIFRVPKENTKIDKEIMDDTIRLSMEDCGNYRHPFLQTGVSHFKKPSSSRQIENDFLDDIFKELEDDYKEASQHRHCK